MSFWGSVLCQVVFPLFCCDSRGRSVRAAAVVQFAWERLQNLVGRDQFY